MEDIEYIKSNREKVQTPKAKTFWCDFCDAQLVHSGSKCLNCGQRQYSKKFKK